MNKRVEVVYDQPWYDVKSAARYLKKSVNAVHKLKIKGKIRHYKDKNGRLVFSKDHLDDFLTSGIGGLGQN